MNGHRFDIAGAVLVALGSGGLWWPKEQVLTVSDLHLGKSERIARRGGPMLPPYEVRETLTRLQTDIDGCGAATVVCLGDSFDDLRAAHSLSGAEKQWITRLQAGRNWVWITGNHDSAPVDFSGAHLAELVRTPLTFRHIAADIAQGEVSGHYHPKFTVRRRGRAITRRCFIYDRTRVILPAYGTFTGGLRSSHPQLQTLFGPDARVVMTGKTPHVLPLASIS